MGIKFYLPQGKTADYTPHLSIFVIDGKRKNKGSRRQQGETGQKFTEKPAAPN
jgi:hypothetical protein